MHRLLFQMVLLAWAVLELVLRLFAFEVSQRLVVAWDPIPMGCLSSLAG